MGAELGLAFVLRSRPYRESSLLLEVFSERWGRLGLVARGRRQGRRQSAQQALYQALQPVLIGWSGRGDLGTLSHIEAAGAALTLRGQAQFCAWYVNELLLRLLHRHDPHPLLFAHYSAALQALVDPDHQRQAWTLRLFERDLLAEIGYGVWLDEAFAPDAQYLMQSGEAPVRIDSASADGAEFAGQRVSGRALLALRDGVMPDAPTMTQLRRLLREALGHALGPEPLQTPRLWQALKALQHDAASVQHAAGTPD